MVQELHHVHYLLHVVQGSINDLPSSLSVDTKIILYADNILLYKPIDCSIFQLDVNLILD